MNPSASHSPWPTDMGVYVAYALLQDEGTEVATDSRPSGDAEIPPVSVSWSSATSESTVN